MLMPASTLQINVVKTYSLFVSTTLYQWGKTHTKGMGIGGPVTLNRGDLLAKEALYVKLQLSLY
jgi:hypothetical protein